MSIRLVSFAQFMQLLFLSN